MILLCINKTNLEIKKYENAKNRKKDANPPGGDGEWARKSLFGEFFYHQWLKYQKNYMIPLFSYT